MKETWRRMAYLRSQFSKILTLSARTSTLYMQAAQNLSMNYFFGEEISRKSFTLAFADVKKFAWRSHHPVRTAKLKPLFKMVKLIKQIWPAFNLSYV